MDPTRINVGYGEVPTSTQTLTDQLFDRLLNLRETLNASSSSLYQTRGRLFGFPKNAEAAAARAEPVPDGRADELLTLIELLSGLAVSISVDASELNSRL